MGGALSESWHPGAKHGSHAAHDNQLRCLDCRCIGTGAACSSSSYASCGTTSAVTSTDKSLPASWTPAAADKPSFTR